MKLAYLCPGQGAQTAGFLHRLPKHAAVARTLDEASGVLGREVSELDSAEALRSTVAVQLAVVVAGTCVARALRDEGVRPDAVAGLSVGAYTAAVIAGVLTLEQCLRLVRLRATLMEQAYPQGYGMAVIGGLPQRAVEAMIEAACTGLEPRRRAYLANLNAPAQFAIAGADEALERVLQAARMQGARRAERLDVAVPSHCPLLAGVATALREALAGERLAEPELPYAGNTTARLLRSARAVAADLADNVMTPVHWHDASRVLFENGMRHFIELPPGQALTQLARSAFCDAHALAAEQADLASLALSARRAQRHEENDRNLE